MQPTLRLFCPPNILREEQLRGVMLKIFLPSVPPHTPFASTAAEHPGGRNSCKRQARNEGRSPMPRPAYNIVTDCLKAQCCSQLGGPELWGEEEALFAPAWFIKSEMPDSDKRGSLRCCLQALLYSVFYPTASVAVPGGKTPGREVHSVVGMGRGVTEYTLTPVMEN